MINTIFARLVGLHIIYGAKDYARYSVDGTKIRHKTLDIAYYAWW